MKKITTLKKAFKILDRLGFEIGFTDDYIPYRIEHYDIQFKKFMNRKEVLRFVNYELKSYLKELKGGLK